MSEKTFFSLSGKSKLYCLLGDPVKHSLSPAMYNYCFRRDGIDACYLAFRVQAKDMPEAVAGIKALGVKGANVTMPGKQLAARLADMKSPVVEMTGAANVLVNNDGRLTAYNTDGSGLFSYLKGERFDPTGKRILILGAGGAAASIAAAAALAGAGSISLFNRRGPSFKTMEQVLVKVSYYCPKVSLLLEEPTKKERLAEQVESADLLINASSIGMAPDTDRSPLPSADLLRPDLPVCDIIYHPRQTLLLQQAAALGARCWDGAGMLLGQGAESYRLFTGRAMPLAEVGRLVLGL